MLKSIAIVQSTFLMLLVTRCSAFLVRSGRKPHQASRIFAYQGRFGSGGGWDDQDERQDDKGQDDRRSRQRPTRDARQSRGDSRQNKGNNASYRGGGNRGGNDFYKRDQGSSGSYRSQPPDENRINLRSLEEAGFDHLYGLSPVLNALQAGRRDFTTSMTDADDENIKPEAQRRPWLLVQSAGATKESSRSAEKSAMASKIMDFAQSYNLPIHYVDKGVLNTLSNNRPHQGFVLRCGKLAIQEFDGDFTKHNFWLVLDQVTDPQNLGALLRSAQFLQCPAVLVCTKNSAPPSAVVSAASAGALESYGNLYATSILPRVLTQANVRIIGASTESPLDEVPLHDLSTVEVDEGATTLLVLGSEGHGLRFSVARACTEFCRIPGTTGDSLNVSVTGGIFLWHMLQTTRG